MPIDTSRDGFVRPRYDDGTFEEPLPFADRFGEWVQSAPGRLVLLGPRGSGLTTTLGWLAELLRRGEGTGRSPRPIDACQVEQGDWLQLRAGEAVLFLDLSVWGRTPLADRQRRVDAIATARLPRLVVAAHGWDDVWFRSSSDSNDVIAHLAPWGADDVLELLGSSASYRPHRARVHRALSAIPQAADLLRRPWTARRLVDAVVRDGCDSDTSLCALYAAVLDGLQPGSLAVLRALPPRACDVYALFEALGSAKPGIESARELADLFQVSGVLAEALGRGELPRHLVECSHATLAFPGLQHFLQAGDCLRRVAQGELPERVERPWLPFFPDLISPGVRESLQAWLSGPDRGGFHDAVAASVLCACGETPPFPPDRPLRGSGALLDELRARGACLGSANLRSASLREAALERASLNGSILSGADLRRARLGGADLSGAWLDGVQLQGAELSQAGLRGANLDGAKLIGACLTGANLHKAQLVGTDLTRADLAGANLTEATVQACAVEGLDLSGADLTLSSFADLDLRQTVGVGPASAHLSSFDSCVLAALSLDELDLRGSRFVDCDLTDLSLRGAHLRGGTFRECAMHGVVCDGADLSGVLFQGVRFQAGSSRSGLLSGKAALEGNMTGFYVEGVSDDAWTCPEAIAQASFRHADLRGARFVGTNLFRVDFRGAQLSEELFAQAREHGAILDDAR